MTLPESGPPVEHAVQYAPGSPVVAQPESVASVAEPAVAEASGAQFTIAVWQLATILTGIVIVVGVLLLGIHPPKVDVSGLPSSIKLLVPALLVAIVGLVLAKKRERQRQSSSES